MLVICLSSHTVGNQNLYLFSVALHCWRASPLPSVPENHSSFYSAHALLFIWILSCKCINFVFLAYFTFLSQLLRDSRNNVFLFQYFFSALLLALSSLLISVTVIYFFSISIELFFIFYISLLKLPTCSGMLTISSAWRHVAHSYFNLSLINTPSGLPLNLPALIPLSTEWIVGFVCLFVSCSSYGKIGLIGINLHFANSQYF